MVKKQIIMDSALELFAKQGFEATSVQQITDKCGISKGAFYLSFKSKDELIFSLLDQFLENLLHSYEQAVKNQENDNNLLYEYCFISFKNIEKNMALAQLFIQEASSMINDRIFERLQSFQVIISQTLRSIIKKQYPTIAQSNQEELVFTINALVKSHTENMLLAKHVGPIELISRAVVEKIEILATRISITTPHITPSNCLNLSSDYLLTLLDEKIEQTTDEIEKESLQLLKAHLKGETMSPAIELGIVRNLHATENLKYIAHMYEFYQKNLL